jgi:intein-encoded DNA endonuclease-like protein
VVSVRPTGKKHVRAYEERVKLYELVRKLTSQGDTPIQIRNKLRKDFSTEVDLTTIKGWKSNKHSPFGRVHLLQADPSPELSYLIGVDFGDTSHRKGSWQHDHTTRLRVKDEDFAREFATAASKVLGSKPTKVWLDKKTGLWQTDVNSILLSRFLNRQLDHLKIYIEHCIHCTAAFLRGFFDAEAGVGNSDLSVSNGDFELISYVQGLLRRCFLVDSNGPYQSGPPPGTLKIIKGRTVRVNKYSYSIHIKPKCWRIFEETIGFTLSRKKEALGKLVESRSPPA